MKSLQKEIMKVRIAATSVALMVIIYTYFYLYLGGTVEWMVIGIAILFLLQIIITKYNLTEMLETKKKLTEEKELLAVTLRSINEGVIVTDLEGEIILMNREAEKLTGWSTETAVGMPIQGIYRTLTINDHQKCLHPVEKVLQTKGVIKSIQKRLLQDRNQHQRIISDSASPLFDKDSIMIGAVLVFRDITEQHKLEEEVMKADKVESLGLLAGGIAHDFNNILTAVVGNISIAKEYAIGNQELYELLKDIEKASLQTKNLTGQLLTFAKGGMPVKKTASITDLIKETVQFCLRGSNINFELSIPENLWHVNCDQGQIAQVINNLTINARQVLTEGGNFQVRCSNIKLKEINCVYLDGGEYVKIAITDNGPGIPVEYRDKIFEPFFTTKEQGTGLGLATAASIIKKHNGRIIIKSKVDRGTTFLIFLPASKSKLEQEGQSTIITPREGKILLMDDEEMVRKVTGKMLTHLGYQVDFVSNGEEAVQRYREAYNADEPFQAVILDLTIAHGMGGKETIKKLHKIDPYVKAIVSSGYSTGPVLANFKEYGFCEVIIKPYKIEELAETLEKAI